jgi:hypothetical protein
VAEHPLTPHHDIARSGLGAISRAYLAPDGDTLYAAVRYPGRVPHLVTISLQNGRVAELQEVRGALPYRVSSLAFDADGHTLFYTTDNFNYRNLLALDLRTHESRMLIEDARIGDIVFNRADKSLWGLRVNNGFVVVVRLKPPYNEWESLYVFPYNEVAWDLDLSPDGTLAAMSLAGPGAEGTGSQTMQLRVMSTARLIEGDATPVSHSSSAPRSPKASCSRRTVGTCTAAPTTPAFPTSIAWPLPRESSRHSATPNWATSTRCRSTSGHCSCSVTPRPASCRRRSRSSRLKT